MYLKKYAYSYKYFYLTHLYTAANQTAETVHKQSLPDWVGTIDVLVRESGGQKSQDIASHFGLAVGSIMRFYSIWNNLHPAARTSMLTWGDADYKAICAEHGINCDQKALQIFDNHDVVGKTSMYPSVWNKNDQTETFQVKAMKKILVHFLRTRKTLNREKVLLCLHYCEAEFKAIACVQSIKDDCLSAITREDITQVDGAQVLAQCEDYLARIPTGALDSKLKSSGDYPSLAIKQLHDRLEATKMLAYERKQAELRRQKKEEEVKICIFD